MHFFLLLLLFVKQIGKACQRRISFVLPLIRFATTLSTTFKSEEKKDGIVVLILIFPQVFSAWCSRESDNLLHCCAWLARHAAGCAREARSNQRNHGGADQVGGTIPPRTVQEIDLKVLRKCN
jgi:hypothetical protein